MHINLTRTFVLRVYINIVENGHIARFFYVVYTYRLLFYFLPNFIVSIFFTGYTPWLERLKDDKTLRKPCGFADRYYNINYESMR